MSLRRRLNAPKLNNNEVVPVGSQAIGIQYPLSDGSRLFSPTYTTVDQIIANLYCLFNTNVGERMLQPELGCELHSVLFEPITTESDFVNKIRNAVTEPIAKWLPYITVANCDVNLNLEEDGRVTEPDHAIAIDLSIAINGTNAYLPIRIFIDETGQLRIIQFGQGNPHG